MISTLKKCKIYQERQTEPEKGKSYILDCDNKSQCYSRSFIKKAILVLFCAVYYIIHILGEKITDY